jgi:murein L,D-transpeptidase YafK
MGTMTKYVAWLLLLLLPGAAALAGADAFGPATGEGMGSTGGTIASTGLSAPGSISAPAAAALPQVERVLVRKSERRLYLMRGEEILRSYRISLGLRPEGSKERAGDYRTPEGSYRLARRNPNSDYFLSIQVTYPGPQDLERARRNHWNPGGSVMVHGQPNTPRHPASFYAREDWTDGCIALSNADMVEFWHLTRENMPIDIEP